MLDLLRARRGLDVKFPKDMIFAHLGFASDGLELTERINYSMTCAQVYNAFARYMFDKGLNWQLFDDLGERDIATDLNGLSSWAPNWSITSSGPRILSDDWCEHVFDYEITVRNFIPDNCEPSDTDAIYHIFVCEPPLLACLGAKLDIVARVGDGVKNSLRRLVEPYRKDLVDLFYCWLWVVNPYMDEHSTLGGYRYKQLYDAIHGLEPDLFTCRLFKDVWESLGNKADFRANKFSLEHLLHFHSALTSIVHRSDLHGWSCIVALTGDGGLAIVPKSTRCGDIVAGLILPTNAKAFKGINPFFVLRPLVAEDEDLEPLLTAKFQQRIRPILHCELVGQCKLGTPRTVLEEQSTPEYEKDAYSFLYSALWKRVMAGSAARGDPWRRCLTDQGGSRITWHTFTIH